MKAFVLGGSGRMGGATVKILAAQPSIEHIAIGGRDLERARLRAAEIGDKASAAQVDATDIPGLAAAIGDYDILVNTSGPFSTTLIPALKAAIAAKIDYIDLLEDLHEAAQVYELEPEVRAAGITAVVGIGFFPGLTNLLAKHAAAQLDTARELHVRIAFAGSLVRDSLSQSRSAGTRNVAIQALLYACTGEMIQHRGGELREVGGATEPVEITTPDGESMTAFPMRLAEALTLPRSIDGLDAVSVAFGVLPASCNQHWRDQIIKLHAGEIEEARAADDLQAALESDPRATLEAAGGYPVRIWAAARGLRDGAPTTVTCEPKGGWGSTGGTLTAATLAVLEGRVNGPGVFAPEAIFEPEAFFREVATLAGKSPDEVVDVKIEPAS